jgi:hypothetical protein
MKAVDPLHCRSPVPAAARMVAFRPVGKTEAAMRRLIPGGLMLACVVLAGCAAAPDVAQSWVGRTTGSLATAWGAPSAVDRLDGGRQMISYRQRKTEAVTDEYGGYSVDYQCTASFLVDPSGTIVSAALDESPGGCKRLLSDRPTGR